MKKVSVSKRSNFKLGNPLDVVKRKTNDCSNKLKTNLSFDLICSLPSVDRRKSSRLLSVITCVFAHNVASIEEDIAC